MSRIHIRFDRQNRVVGWWGAIGLDAVEQTLDFVAANGSKRAKFKKTNENLSANAAFKNSIK